MEFYAGEGAVFQQVSQVFRRAVATDIEYGRHMKSDRIQNNPHDILGEAGLSSGPKIQLPSELGSVGCSPSLMSKNTWDIIRRSFNCSTYAIKFDIS